MDASFDLKRESGHATRNDALRIATDLRRVAASLEKASAVDEQSTEIRARLIQLITNRATAFDKAENDSMIATAASANREAFEAAFNDFAEWENRTVQDFQRVFER